MRLGGATFGILAAAGLLLAASCSDDELNSTVQTDGEEAVISFSVGLDAGAQTRAISDGGSINQLVYAVYDESGETLFIGPQTQNVTAFPTTVSLSLAKELTYTVVFWAQKSGTGYYDTSELTAVKVNYTTTTSGDADNAESTTGALNNDDTRDAFFKTVKVEVSGSASETVELTRPFAQINVGVTKEDWDAAVASGITIAQSSVTLSGVANVINLLDGSVSLDSSDGFNGSVSYASADIPADLLIVSGAEYNWLSMSYILVDDESTDPDDDGVYGTQKTTLETLDFAFTPASGNNITLNLTSVPVQRNYRTNILGSLLTGDIDFTITIDNEYSGNVKTNYIGTEAELIAAASAGGSYILISDVDLSSAVSVTVSDLTLDLNGHSITSSESFDSSNDFLIAVDEGGVLTINDESEEATGSVGAGTNYSIKVNSGGSLIINGGTFNSFVISYGTLEISGGTFNGDVDCSGTGSMTISGGTFSGQVYCMDGTITISGGTFTGDVDCYDGGAIEISGGEFSGKVYCSYAGSITISGGMFSGSLTCYADEYDSTATIEISGGTFYGELTCIDDGTITITDGTFNGDVTVVDGIAEISGGEFSGEVYCYGNGTIEISGGEFTGDVTCISEASPYTANITITGGTFTGDITCSAADGGTANITITGGTFSGSLTSSADEYGSTATITISGGTFSNDPSDYVDTENYTVSDNGDGTYTVTKS